MASSRLEKVGTIYTRVKGLMRAGAMRVEDKPIWYDVYEAFPPKNLQPSTSTEPLRPIFYAEDAVRARFHKEKVFNESVNLMDTQRQTRCQQFIAKYQEHESENPEKEHDEVFAAALDSFRLSTSATAPVLEEKVNSGDSTLSASFKNAFNSSERKPRARINIAEIVKDD